jgi:hypothetical protein
MGRGKWTRWGRGSCEGWSLWIGDIVRGQVTRGSDVPPTWQATMNGSDLGKHRSREEAVARVEDAVMFSMKIALEDWSIFRPQAKRPNS